MMSKKNLLDRYSGVETMENRIRCPAHPGRILKNLYLTPLGLSVSKVAEILEVSRNAVSAIVNGRRAVTPEMALRLSQAFTDSTPESWLNLQRNYDLWQAIHKTKAWKAVQPVPMVVREDQAEYKTSDKTHDD